VPGARVLHQCPAAPREVVDKVACRHDARPGGSGARGALVPQASYGNGTSSWTYKYRDHANIHNLLHVIFGEDGRVLRAESEWDPDVYSKGDGMRR
jgi:hypothetical protein